MLVMSDRTVEIILYVRSQDSARDFYSAVLDQKPDLDDSGILEYLLNEGVCLAIMPIADVAPMFAPMGLDPSSGIGIPRGEVYLRVKDPEAYLERLVAAGGTLISPVAPTDWGEDVGYGADPDGHILTFARLK